jgi:hypothetical protein
LHPPAGDTSGIKKGPDSVDTVSVKPRFGQWTQALAIIFLLIGLRDWVAGFSVGAKGTIGTENNPALLFVLGLIRVVLGLALISELPWAWWAALAITGLTVVMDIIHNHHGAGTGWLPQSALLIALAVSGFQGRRHESRSRG